MRIALVLFGLLLLATETFAWRAAIVYVSELSPPPKPTPQKNQGGHKGPKKPDPTTPPAPEPSRVEAKVLNLSGSRYGKGRFTGIGCVTIKSSTPRYIKGIYFDASTSFFPDPKQITFYTESDCKGESHTLRHKQRADFNPPREKFLSYTVRR
jgi:hypothetical protein